LPTDDVLIVRKAKGKTKEADGAKPVAFERAPSAPWKTAQTLKVQSERKAPLEPSALVVESLDDLRWIVRRAPELSTHVRAVVASHIPSGTVSLLAGLGILTLSAPSEVISQLKSQPQLSVPDPREWNGTLQVTSGNAALATVWLAVGAEREWTAAGRARPANIPAKR
jgi:hypothetical protein